VSQYFQRRPDRASNWKRPETSTERRFKKNSARIELTVGEWRDVFRSRGYVCYLCGDIISRRLDRSDRQSRSVDHVRPVSRGGTNDPLNLRPTHLGCNLARGNKRVTQCWKGAPLSDATTGAFQASIIRGIPIHIGESYWLPILSSAPSKRELRVQRFIGLLNRHATLQIGAPLLIGGGLVAYFGPFVHNWFLDVVVVLLPYIVLSFVTSRLENPRRWLVPHLDHWQVSDDQPEHFVDRYGH
jgi:hypothetical protein